MGQELLRNIPQMDPTKYLPGILLQAVGQGLSDPPCSGKSSSKGHFDLNRRRKQMGQRWLRETAPVHVSDTEDMLRQLREHGHCYLGENTESGSPSAAKARTGVGWEARLSGM